MLSHFRIQAPTIQKYFVLQDSNYETRIEKYLRLYQTLQRGSICKVGRPKVNYIDYFLSFHEKITPNNFQNNIFLKSLLKPFEWCVNYDKM
jgi:hypothetical protein